MQQVIQTRGARKTSVASLRLMPGSGAIYANRKTLQDYFPTQALVDIVRKPLRVVGISDAYDIHLVLKGGGTTGQADAACHAIARALDQLDAAYRALLRKEKLLTRDPRAVEPKKAGQKKARKKFAWVKR